jgi:hypothetical protein
MSCACSCVDKKVIVHCITRTIFCLWWIAAACGALAATQPITSAGIPPYAAVPIEPTIIRQTDKVLRASNGWPLTGAHVGLAGASFCPTICGSVFSTVDAGLYAVQGDYVTAGICIAAAGAGLLSDAGAAKLLGLGIKASVEAKVARNLAMTANQIALKTLASEATTGGRKALSTRESQIVIDWAQETNYPTFRASANDLAFPSNWTANPIPHIHLPGAVKGGHIPVAPGLAPVP